MSRLETTAGQLVRRGFDEPERALTWLARWREGHQPLLDVLARAADPDLALAGLDAILDRRPELLDELMANGVLAEQLVMVLGASRAFRHQIAGHPEQVDLLAEHAVRRTAAELRHEMLTAVGADPEAAMPVAADSDGDTLRTAYRAALLRIAARDVSSAHPTEVVDDVAAELADLADATLEAALAIARVSVDDADKCRLAVIGLGKCGAGELNYVSDVDVLYVVEPVVDENGEPLVDTGELVRIGTRLASWLARVCSAHTAAGTIWQVDAGLRPEGNAGPLVRTLASHTSYYDKWAKTWEFQAMLKARPSAGDRALGEEFCAMISPLVWQVAEHDGFVEDVRAMRKRVVDLIPTDHEGRELKLGAGGLRDVEFSVQLLQLVHGRVDERLRLPGTLPALAALVDHGYVGRSDGAELAEAYRFLRTVEHRIQLSNLRRTHLLPEDEEALRSLGRTLWLEGRGTPDQLLLQHWRSCARRVLRLHQRLFYSPVLQAVAQLPTDELRLTTAAASDRLQALGFSDPRTALTHVQALTQGVTRQAEIQRQLMPVLLGWLADAPNPDHGLLAFRQISESLGRTPWYLRALRDEGAMAQRFATLLGSSRYVVDLFRRTPEAVQMLAAEEVGEHRTLEEWRTEMGAAARRHDDPARAVQAIRAVRRRGLLQIAAADVLQASTISQVSRALTDLASATVDSALEVAMRDYQGPPIAVIGMGRWGGREMAYASDADAMFVLADGGDADAVRNAAAVITRLRESLSGSGPVPALSIDIDLRPEGRGGPVIRTMSAYRAYYERWSSTWEMQAMVRASAMAGDAELGAELITEIDRRRWPEGGLTSKQLVEIRRLKARMEAERLPRGTDRRRNLKLGPGGLSDVEWTVQVLQLQHAAEVPALRVTSTQQALGELRNADLIKSADAEILDRAWVLASRIRDLSMLVRGKASDSLPSDVRDLSAVAELMGRGPSKASHLLAEHSRVTRRVGAVVDRLFWGS
ncbi:bifunctional [glutamine synthetase] adenylyltransferase/[glutamine synthetase]-adenylyl-L-tyrosine phosphorylase [Propionibacteriaceae bacterium Y1700]|uniref:bifunctional [glutamine synthetase] adenylyltransferase/[glutamine synthetase]-adenylyl-L-tyrosine phosphorylase n=1 Tax=Microlunatus sp. Y1700 TaxID=3418487 RepID=UPI003DA759A4